MTRNIKTDYSRRAAIAAAPVQPAAPAQPVAEPTHAQISALPDIDALAQEIRRVDGNHKMGAGALAEALMPFLRASRGQAPAGVLEDAELGRIAMRFVDRAGDPHPGIDDAETICREFYAAMSEALDLRFRRRVDTARKQGGQHDAE